jgi:membrane protein YqaA with SNARE-associated domain
MVDAEIISEIPAWAMSLTKTLGYFGVFLVSFIGYASIIFPIPSFVLVFFLGSVMNPWLVALSAALGNSLGELTGYAVGKGGGKLIERKHKKWIEKYKGWLEKDRTFILIVFFAATPLPDDVVGILCGIFNYDVKKFALASFIGKLIMNLMLAFGGFYGIRWVLAIFGSMAPLGV